MVVLELLLVDVAGVLDCVELEDVEEADVLDEVLLVVGVLAAGDGLVLVSPPDGVLVAFDASVFCVDPSAVMLLPDVPEPPPQAARISVVKRIEGKVSCFN